MKLLINKVLEFALSASGLLLLFCVNWKIGIGAFLFVWGNNIFMSEKIKNKT
jgi:hypothetical protein